MRILFVCVGNTCRSPAAEAIGRFTAPDHWRFDSAGVRPRVEGADATAEMTKLVVDAGYPIEPHTARALVLEDFDRHDRILALEPCVMHEVEARFGRRIELITSVAGLGDDGIEDPFDTGRYPDAFGQIEVAIRALVSRLRDA